MSHVCSVLSAFTADMKFSGLYTPCSLLKALSACSFIIHFLVLLLHLLLLHASFPLKGKLLELMLDTLPLNFICGPSAYIPQFLYRNHFSKSFLAQLGGHFL